MTAVAESLRERIMAEPLRCRVGLHDWRKTYDHERQMSIKECAACGKRISSGWPGALGGYG